MTTMNIYELIVVFAMIVDLDHHYTKERKKKEA